MKHLEMCVTKLLRLHSTDFACDIINILRSSQLLVPSVLLAQCCLPVFVVYSAFVRTEFRVLVYCRFFAAIFTYYSMRVTFTLVGFAFRRTVFTISGGFELFTAYHAFVLSVLLLLFFFTCFAKVFHISYIIKSSVLIIVVFSTTAFYNLYPKELHYIYFR